MTTFVLVRHAVHDHPPDLLVGRSPGVGLGEPGRRQAARLASRLAPHPVAAVHSSPLERARATAEAIARHHGLPVVTCDALAEVDYGRWTGRTFASLDGDPAWDAWNGARSTASTPDGESMAAVQRRALAGLDRIAAATPDGEVVAVSHADVLRAVIVAVLGMHLDDCLRVDVSPASLTIVERPPTGPAIVRCVNDTAHLG